MKLSRPIKNNLLLLLSIFFTQKICAQLLPADDFFDSGAQLYISNNIPAALEKTETGLKLYPDDEKLKKLEKLLKQQQQSQSQQNQQQQNQKNQQNKSQSQQQQSQQNQSQQNQNSPQQKNQQSQNQQNQNQQQAQNQNQQQEKNGEKEKEQKQNGEEHPVAPGQMSPEEAKRLLNAQKGDEQFLQLKPQGKPQTIPSGKDW